jgi:multidrug resistance efflux pump
MAKDRARAAQEALDAADAAQEAAEIQFGRQEALKEKGLASARELELAELDLSLRRTERNRADANLQAATSEVLAVEAERKKVAADNDANIEGAQAEQERNIADEASAQAEIARAEVRLARQSTQRVTAPRDGVVMRLLANQGGELVKAGDPLLTLVPEANDRAVELWADGNDAPLILPGMKVRLQFEGWPAVQFAGWPSVAVGTFGGVVSLVDAADDGKGKFRVLVTPDPDDTPWPEPRYLRQGGRANGWVLLNEVSIGYELWRQLNGFPPALNGPAPTLQTSAKEAK